MIDTGRAFGLVAALSAGAASAVRLSGNAPVLVPRRERSEVGARGLLTVREKLSGDNRVEEPRARAAADAKGGGGAGGIGKCCRGRAPQLGTARRVGSSWPVIYPLLPATRHRAPSSSAPRASCWQKFARSFTRPLRATRQRAAIRKTLGARNAAAHCREALMLRFGRRSYGTLVKIWPRGTPAATSGEGLCVYITGFMSDTKDDGYWESWLPAHRQLVAAPLPWPEQAYGYRWQTGATGDWLGRWPLPVHAAALLARRSSPAALLAGITADSLVNATRCTPAILFSPSTLRTHPHQPHTPPAPPSPHPTPTLSPSPADHPQHSTPSRLLLHYRSAESAAVAEAPRLARACAAFGGDYRVVAHSLGCRLALEALPSLPAEQRPREVRLRRSPSFSSSTHAPTQPAG